MIYLLLFSLALSSTYKDREEWNKARRSSKLWNTPLKDHPMSRPMPLDSRRHLFKSIKLDDECYTAEWPNIPNCVYWKKSGDYMIGTSNDIPTFYVPPYCPFGIGEGYCQSPTEGNSTDCAPFRGLTCPCDPNADHSKDGINCPAATTKSGDVVVPIRHDWIFPLHPDPTNESKPIHMYDSPALVNTDPLSPHNIAYQVIGAHIEGLQIKGPAEANGFNVDISLIPLDCGGHFTPPVGAGTTYHFHKMCDCFNITEPGEHGKHFGWANDGFKMYGAGDFSGSPVLDECRGHFGPVDRDGTIEYHYHTQGVWNLPGTPHKPYYMGCQGPSKGRCNETVNPNYDNGKNWCGPGCGHEICVQPGTDKEGLRRYLAQFGKPNWLDNFDVNDF